MQLDDVTAFVLHTRPWRETSLLVEVLTDQHGRVGLIARGVQGAKRHVLRAALQPLQHIRLSMQMRGELGRLVSAEALDAAPRLRGETMLSAFYVNELMLRLVPRQDPQPDLYVAYAKVRARLAHGAALPWTLRRFERDLLDCLGFGVGLDTDGDGEPIDPAARYRLDPEHGARRLLSERTGERQFAPTGQALLALAADTLPEPSDLADLRRAMRQLLSHHLGPRGLKSWEMLAALPRPVRPEPDATGHDGFAQR